MRKLLLLAPLALLAAGCQTTPRPYNPVRNVAYSAVGQDPFWVLTIGDDRIVLRQGDSEGVIWPRTLPRIVDGVQTWESGDDTAVIAVQSTPGPCEDRTGRRFEDHVRVRLSGSELNGCGGRLLEGPRS